MIALDVLETTLGFDRETDLFSYGADVDRAVYQLVAPSRSSRVLQCPCLVVCYGQLRRIARSRSRGRGDASVLQQLGQNNRLVLIAPRCIVGREDCYTVVFGRHPQKRTRIVPPFVYATMLIFLARVRCRGFPIDRKRAQSSGRVCAHALRFTVVGGDSCAERAQHFDDSGVFRCVPPLRRSLETRLLVRTSNDVRRGPAFCADLRSRD